MGVTLAVRRADRSAVEAAEQLRLPHSPRGAAPLLTRPAASATMAAPPGPDAANQTRFGERPPFIRANQGDT
jgi:hypothetical protein